MVFKPVFARETEQSIASFSYVDIADGTGVRTFYGTQGRDTSTQRYLLMQNAEYPEEPKITSNQDIDFDLTAFNLPQTVRGTAIVSVGAFIDGTGTYTLTCQLRKVSDGAETNLSSAIADSVSNTDPNAAKMMLIRLPITEQTGFKRGDILRLNITTSGNVGTSFYGTNPLGLDDGAISAANNLTTILKVLVPFRIDI